MSENAKSEGPTPGAVLARFDEIPDKGAIVRDLREGEKLYSFVLARRGDVLAAYWNICPHAHVRMETFDGQLIVRMDRYLMCTLHGAMYDLGDGRCAAAPGGGDLEKAPIELVDGEVRIAGIRLPD